MLWIGLAFGLAHGLVEGLPILIVFGAGLAWLRARTDERVPGDGRARGVQRDRADRVRHHLSTVYAHWCAPRRCSCSSGLVAWPAVRRRHGPGPTLTLKAPKRDHLPAPDRVRRPARARQAGRADPSLAGHTRSSPPPGCAGTARSGSRCGSRARGRSTSRGSRRALARRDRPHPARGSRRSSSAAGVVGAPLHARRRAEAGRRRARAGAGDPQRARSASTALPRARPGRARHTESSDRSASA